MTSNSTKKRREWVVVAALPSPTTTQFFEGNPSNEEKSIANKLFNFNGSGQFKSYGQTSSKVIIKNGICKKKVVNVDAK